MIISYTRPIMIIDSGVTLLVMTVSYLIPLCAFNSMLSGLSVALAVGCAILVLFFTLWGFPKRGLPNAEKDETIQRQASPGWF